MEVTTHSTEETKKLAEELASEINPGTVVALYGDLGAGKTTFTRFLTEALGSNSRVQSPTFVIARKYQGVSDSGPSAVERIFHLDLYRIKTKEELNDLDLPQFFSDKGAVTIIEWPELAERLLPKNTIRIKFKYVDENSRKINVDNIH